MKKILIVLFLFFALSAKESRASFLLADLNYNKILVDARFSGAKLFLFGQKAMPGSLIIIVRGPKKNFIVRKKESFFGVWLNRKQMNFQDIYSFYNIYSSEKQLSKEVQSLLWNLNLDIENKDLKYKGKAYLDELPQFKQAILDKNKEGGVYSYNLGKIDFMGDTLFKTEIEFPSKIAYGKYNAEIYLINQGKLSAMQILPIEVKKTGIEAMIYNFAKDNSMLYGLACVLIAMLFGYIASLVFWRRT
jgi:uncharacterized protein (TIGR02186 family)